MELIEAYLRTTIDSCQFWISDRSYAPWEINCEYIEINYHPTDPLDCSGIICIQKDVMQEVVQYAEGWQVRPSTLILCYENGDMVPYEVMSLNIEEYQGDSVQFRFTAKRGEDTWNLSQDI
ncbi:hypothetical protein [Alicyclobacillus shizuokensis]|uniref:hypothetical protein n=1 Tax=Alicyclobacillus shizuokensis TaxID=392014 RepID=UPI00082F72A1|nr:hypothetical protein [Alicyclobacillus shizuokensis]